MSVVILLGDGGRAVSDGFGALTVLIDADDGVIDDGDLLRLEGFRKKLGLACFDSFSFSRCTVPVSICSAPLPTVSWTGCRMSKERREEKDDDAVPSLSLVRSRSSKEDEPEVPGVPGVVCRGRSELERLPALLLLLETRVDQKALLPPGA